MKTTTRRRAGLAVLAASAAQAAAGDVEVAVIGAGVFGA